MIGLDTNVLVRYIVQDDPEQSVCATEYIESECSQESPGVIQPLTLCELVWVLRRAYRYDKPIIVNVLQQILATAEFAIPDTGLVWGAFRDYREGPADFADYLMGRMNRAYGCEHTATFDRRAGEHPAFLLLKRA